MKTKSTIDGEIKNNQKNKNNEIINEWRCYR
jgi:hypothetical protein